MSLDAPALPEGEVTLLFTDVEGSTRLWELHGERMLALLREHDAIVADAVAGAGGVLQTNRAEGDSSFAIFADASAALRGAIALQRGMAAHPWPADLVIRTRAALHTGVVEVRGDTYYGPVVNRCVRLRSLAHGGQTIASRSTRDAAAALPDGATFTDLGTHRLKDLAVPERVYELHHPDLAGGFPPLRSPDVERHNLPEVIGRFVGRADDRRAITKLLQVERLVTAVGTGGVGKTRLALEVAWRYAERNEGAWFANLTPATSTNDVAAIVAEAIGAREQPGRPLVETIVDHLGTDAALVVLDNCEHVVSAVQHLVPVLLRGCPNLRLLATSREALALDGERRRGLTGLSPSEARDLFLDRARLDIDPADTDALAAIDRACLPLDGIPLAIEIAAARAADLGADAIAEGVARAQVEAAGRTALEAALAWSHDLLDADEQLLFRRLGAFAGQFTLAAAESVVADEDLDAADVLDVLAALVDRSLVLRTDEGGYRQLFVVREMAQRLARTAGEFDALAAQHLAWCLSFAVDRRRPELDERARFDPLRQVNDELVAALEREFPDEIAGLQVELAGALEEFWYLRGAFSETRAHLERVLARGAGFRSHRAVVHRILGHVVHWQGDLGAALDHLAQARALFEEILAELRASDSPHLPAFEHQLAMTLLQSSEITLARGDAADAKELATVARALPGPTYGYASLHLGLAEHALGERAASDAHLDAALQFASEGGDDVLAGDCHRARGVLARFEDQLGDAEAHYRRALEVDRRLGGEQVLARTLLNLAEVLQLRGDPSTDALDEGLELARALGDRLAEAHGLVTLAEIVADRDPDEAAQLHEQALAIRQSVGVPSDIAVSQLRVAAYAARAGKRDEAIALTERAISTFETLHDDRRLAEATAQLRRLQSV